MDNIKFENGNTITILPEEEHVRGVRSNFITALCVDRHFKKRPSYYWVTIDFRKPLEKYIPVYYLLDEELHNEFSSYRKYYNNHPVEFAVMVMGKNLKWYQKLALLFRSKFR